MKTIEIEGILYTFSKTGYGNWDVTNGKITRHTTDSQMIDWINDDSDEKEHQNAINALLTLFEG